MNEDRSPLPFLNTIERKLLGPLVARLFANANPRLQRAIEDIGIEASARMACVNALRIYAIVLFVLGTAGRFAAIMVLAYGFYGLAAAAMAWSFWCLYTVVGPERAFKRDHSAGPGLV